MHFMSENGIEIFENNEFGTVRTLLIEGNPWFIGKDVAEALGYSNARDALARHVADEDKADVAIHDGRQNRNMTAVNESGLYALIFGSKLESAKRFKRWVTSEVLPAIRKTGTYTVEQNKEIAISTHDIAEYLNRKHCKVLWRIDRYLVRHPEQKKNFIDAQFENTQGRVFRSYDLTKEGLEVYLQILKNDGERNTVQTAAGIERIRREYLGNSALEITRGGVK